MIREQGMRRNIHSHPVSWHDFDSELSNSAAQLREDLMAWVALHPIKSSAVDPDYSALDVDEIVFSQFS